MEYLVTILLTFIGLLMLMQMIMFEITYNRVKKTNQINWYTTLTKPFAYTRVRYMMFICGFCYLLSSPFPMFSMSWILYLVLFIAMGVVSDAVVQYLILKYGQLRCKNEIANATQLSGEFKTALDNAVIEDTYVESPKEYNEIEIAHKYINQNDHMSFLTVDGGNFVKEFGELPDTTFVVEPYGDIEKIEEELSELPVKVTKLTESGQMPFKDSKMDSIVCQICNYDKFEIVRVLKDRGYFIVNQNGTANFKEFMSIYMPYGMKGKWDADYCELTLQDFDMEIVEKVEEHGTVTVKSVGEMIAYFNKVSPDLSDTEKYNTFYLKVYQDIKEHGTFTLSTYRFLVVGKNSKVEEVPNDEVYELEEPQY